MIEVFTEPYKTWHIKEFIKVTINAKNPEINMALIKFALIKRSKTILIRYPKRPSINAWHPKILPIVKSINKPTQIPNPKLTNLFS